MEASKHYSTTNIYEASFLIARGFSIEDIQKGHGRKAAVLLAGEEIGEAVRDYYNGGSVSGKAMTDAYRMIKDRLFE
jgi:hypothetical protein